jgi:hypothetical protein
VDTLREAEVCAYFAICATEVLRKEDGLSGSVAGGYSRIPGYLIARLALDISLQGKGYGEHLLLHALSKGLPPRRLVEGGLSSLMPLTMKHSGSKSSRRALRPLHELLVAPMLLRPPRPTHEMSRVKGRRSWGNIKRQTLRPLTTRRRFWGRTSVGTPDPWSSALE